MIPKIIHYCWFGRGPKPALAERCIASWRKYLPDYEIKEWNEDNFDVNSIPYTEEAYRVRKYAFVSDYARFWILYKYGGVYFDTDVELIRPIDFMISKGNFLGVENSGIDLSKPVSPSTKNYYVNPGLGMCAEANLAIFKEIRNDYEQSHFILSDGKMNPENVVGRTTKILFRHGLKITKNIQVVDGLTIYPMDWMCPIRTTDGKMFLTENTVSIHHYAASWTTPLHRFLRKVLLAIGGAKFKVWLKEKTSK